MAKNYSKEAKQFRDNYLRKMYDVDPAKSNIKIPEEHVPPHLRPWIDKVNIEPKNPLTIAERKTPITIARIISPDTSKDLSIKSTMLNYGKGEDGKYKSIKKVIEGLSKIVPIKCV